MPPITKLPPLLDGEVRFDRQARATAAEDFGHLLRRAPEGVLLPGSAEDLIRLPPTDDPAVAGRLVAANRAAFERVRDAGGTLYPVSAFPMSPADWRGHFGAAFGPLAEAKGEHDPGRVLTPGYEVF